MLKRTGLDPVCGAIRQGEPGEGHHISSSAHEARERYTPQPAHKAKAAFRGINAKKWQAVPCSLNK